MVPEQVTDCHYCSYIVSHLQHYDHTCSWSRILVLLVLIQWLPSNCFCGVVPPFLQICLYDISHCTTILRQHLWWVCIDMHGSCMKPGWEDYVQWTGGSGRHEAWQRLHLPILCHQSQDTKSREYKATGMLWIVSEYCILRWLSSYWLPIITNFFLWHMIQELENPVILVHEKKNSSINSILPVLEMVVQVSHCHLFHALFKRVMSFILIS